MSTEIPATVTRIEGGGTVTRVAMRAAGGVNLMAVVTQKQIDEMGLAPGRSVVAQIHPNEIRVALKAA